MEFKKGDRVRITYEGEVRFVYSNEELAEIAQGSQYTILEGGFE